MANAKIILPDQQQLELPEELAGTDEALRDALASFVPEIRNAELKRETKDGLMTVTVIKKSGTKGGRGEKNCYRCEKCGKAIITIDHDDGTTPMMIRCRATLNCEGWMMSSWYQNVPNEEPTYTWRKAKPSEYRKASVVMKDHFDKGGLALHQLARG